MIKSLYWKVALSDESGSIRRFTGLASAWIVTAVSLGICFERSVSPIWSLLNQLLSRLHALIWILVEVLASQRRAGDVPCHLIAYPIIPELMGAFFTWIPTPIQSGLYEEAIWICFSPDDNLLSWRNPARIASKKSAEKTGSCCLESVISDPVWSVLERIWSKVRASSWIWRYSPKVAIAIW